MCYRVASLDSRSHTLSPMRRKNPNEHPCLTPRVTRWEVIDDVEPRIIADDDFTMSFDDESQEIEDEEDA
jgi:hypothetical protein